MAMPVVTTAAPVTYDFTVTATTGPLAGTVESGFFTFDSSIIPAALPGSVTQTGLFTDLEFTWNGIAYTEATANTGFLAFNGAGELSAAIFGTNCVLDPGTCTQTPGANTWAVGFGFTYATPETTTTFAGTVEFQQRANVAEPASLVLLACGGAATAWIARRRTTRLEPDGRRITRSPS